MSPNFSSFGSRVKQLRLTKGLKQDELAEILGTKKPSISQWENGTSTPSFAMFCDLVTYFNISADYLLGRSLVGGEAPPPIDPEVAGYLDKARAVLESPDGAHLKAVIEAMSKARSS